MITLNNILVPVDFSEHSSQAVEYATELAARFGGRVHLLHVVEPLILAMPSPGAPLPEKLLDDAESDAVAELKKWLTSETEKPLCGSKVVRRGAPFLEIVRHAKEHDMDLVVLGTHGRSGLQHTLIGSVAEKVVRKAPCPVLTVRPEGHQFVMP